MTLPCQQLDTINLIEEQLTEAQKDAIELAKLCKVEILNGIDGETPVAMERHIFDNMLYKGYREQGQLIKAVKTTVDSINVTMAKIEPYILDKLEDKKAVDKWQNKISSKIIFAMLIINFVLAIALLNDKVFSRNIPTPTKTEIPK